MNTVPQHNYEAAKVLAKACTWADRHKAVQAAPAKAQRRAKGRYDVSVGELAEAVEQFRKQGGQP